MSSFEREWRMERGWKGEWVGWKEGVGNWMLCYVKREDGRDGS